MFVALECVGGDTGSLHAVAAFFHAAILRQAQQAHQSLFFVCVNCVFGVPDFLDDIRLHLAGI